VTDLQNAHASDFVGHAQARIHTMNQAARELVEELGLPPEAACDVLSEMYGKRMPLGDSVLGMDIRTGEHVTLMQEERLGGLYIVGKGGTGKSWLIANLIEHDMRQNLGLCLLDPHGDAIERVLASLPSSREKDVILIDALDEGCIFGLNLFQCEDWKDAEQYSRTVSYAMGIFTKLFAGGDSQMGLVMAEVLQNVVMTLVENPGCTLAEIPLLLQDEGARAMLVKNVTNKRVRHFWRLYDHMDRQERQYLTESTLIRVGVLLADPVVLHIFGQSKTTIDFRRIMDEGKILLVKLSSQHSSMTALVGAAIVGQLLEAARSRTHLQQERRRPFHLYVDELQHFAIQDMAVLLAEARKFAVATTVAHQFRDQLDDANKSATLTAANLVAFQVGGKDGEELATQFGHTFLPEARRGAGEQRTSDVQAKIVRTLVSLQKYVALVRVGGSEYLVTTRPPKERHSQPEREARLKRMRKQTQAHYCKPRNEVDSEIEVRLGLLRQRQLSRKSRLATESSEDLI